MLIPRRSQMVGLGLAAVLSLTLFYVAPWRQVVTQDLPEQFSDAEFSNLIDEFSETGGYFRSDNFISNETTFQYVIPDLHKKTTPGGVYIGVGPDQNFTYIAALQPKVAFITDIRRQNLLEHLMYKAVFELSNNRAEFLSKLFSRPMPGRLPERVTTEQLFAVFNAEEPNPELEEQNLNAILEQLRDRHGLSLSADDIKGIEYVYTSFVSAGPEIRYSFPNQYGWRRFPSYSELMLETDEKGVNHSYMASEEHFQAIRRLEVENRIVPIVADFAGEKALRSIGRYLKEHRAVVTAFYTSNVEFYLFQSEDWKKFLNNVAYLPVDHNSLFIRAYFNNYGFRFPNQPFGARSVTLLDSITGLQAAFDSGQIRSYFDVIMRSQH